jgi:hypothetical protein
VPALEFVPVPDAKVAKNRLHLDVAPLAGGVQAAEVDRLLALGARRTDVGQGSDVSWVVLADPEGNELCVLTPRCVRLGASRRVERAWMHPNGQDAEKKARWRAGVVPWRRRKAR